MNVTKGHFENYLLKSCYPKYEGERGKIKPVNNDAKVPLYRAQVQHDVVEFATISIRLRTRVKSKTSVRMPVSRECCPVRIRVRA